MDPSRLKRIADIYAEARLRAIADRSAFLDRACGDDHALRAEVEALLREDETAAADAPTVVSALDAHDSASTGASGAGVLIPGYEIVREIAHGGQGVVYLAIETATKSRVAVKVLLAGAYASEATRKRFEREIELAAQLRHPNIINILHAGRTPDGRQFYAMEYVRGRPLNVFVRDKRLNREQALRVFATVCDAMQFAHQRGIIHRDLKPSNVLVDESPSARRPDASDADGVDGVPKVLDFGLGKWLAGPIQTVVSMTRDIVGTLQYMSPEQARGNPDDVDARSDVYSLGVMLYELLTGHSPYPVIGSLAEIIRNITDAAPVPPERAWSRDQGVPSGGKPASGSSRCPIDRALSQIVLKALDKDAARRYQSAGELARDLRRYLAGEPIEIDHSLIHSLRRSLKRYRRALAIGCAAAVLLAAAGGMGVWMYVVRQEKLARQHVAARQSVELARKKIDTRELAEAEKLLEQAFRDAPHLEQLYVQRAILHAVRGLDAPLEKKQACVDGVIEDLYRAHLAAGGEPFLESSPSGWQRDPDATSGSPQALRFAAEFLAFVGRPDDGEAFAVQAKKTTESAPAKADVGGLSAIYSYSLDPLALDQRSRDELALSPELAHVTPDRDAEIVRVVNRKSFDQLIWGSPADREICDLIYEPCFVVTAQGQCIPNPTVLSGDAEPSDDDMVWTIRLREDLKWEDGHAATAEDLVFTWELMNGEERRREPEPIADIVADATNKHVARVRMLAPNPLARWDLCIPLAPRHRCGKEKPVDEFLSELDRKPFGYGAYRVAQKDAASVLLERRDDARPPSFCRMIRVIAQPERGERLQMWASARVDEMELRVSEFAWWLNGSSFSNRASKAIAQVWAYDFIAWNLRCDVLRDRAAREALARALDRDALRAAFSGGVWQPSNGPFSRFSRMADRNLSPVPYDPAGAAQQLEKIGWKLGEDGVRRPPRDQPNIRLYLRPENLHLGRAIEYQLARSPVGVKMELEADEAPLSRLEPDSSDCDAAYGSVITSPHPSGDRSRWHSKGDQNFVGYSNPSVDDAFEKARQRSAKEGADRAAYYTIQREVAYEQPYLFLWERPSQWALSPRLRGVEMNAPQGPARCYPGPRGWWVAK